MTVHAVDDVEGCLACDLLSGRRALPGGRILTTAYWAVEHCFGPLGVGTLLVKPLRHVTSVAELNADEAAEMGPLLAQSAQVVEAIAQPEQVYVGLWSHAGRKRVHIHFVVQPATTYDIDDIGGHGPALQVGMFERNEYPPVDEVEVFADRARELFSGIT